MKEQPILFSAPMVRAILDGSKTQTRRVVKPQLGGLPHPQARCPGSWDWIGDFDHGCGMGIDSTHCFGSIACPYGKPGDQLWVRECISKPYPADVAAENFTGFYKASNESRNVRWTPSIHMPRWASRITLEITGVRVERLNSISEGDAMDEGAGSLLAEHEYLDGNPDQYRRCFEILWESINGLGSWNLNPYVWVVEFKRLNP
jgi:hypothetical protein